MESTKNYEILRRSWSNEGDVMKPHIFKPKQRVNEEVYLEVLKKKVVPWIGQNTQKTFGHGKLDSEFLN